MEFTPEILALAEEAEAMVRPVFERIDKTALKNTEKVLDVFRENRVDEGCFAGTTGYGYNDKGRDKLDKMFASLIGGEDGVVRTTFVNGTHAITCALYGALMPGDTLLSAVGAPYDTLMSVIRGEAPLTLEKYGIGYREVPLDGGGKPDKAAIARAAAGVRSGAALIQRSRGYSFRDSLSVDEIGELIKIIRAANPALKILVDNCYGEFVEEREPGEMGADLVMGSLIKNPGGGLAPMGGYIVGKHEYVEAACARMTVPGIGRECGASLYSNRSLYQGLFMAPHVTAQALKTAVFCSAIMRLIGYETLPGPLDERHDITQMIKMGSPEALCAICEGIQAGAPVDSFVRPEPWDMPGYDDPVIMAAGAFIQGASIELSCDGPMREPYMAYMQGGLTYESGKLGVLLAVQKLVKIAK